MLHARRISDSFYNQSIAPFMPPGVEHVPAMTSLQATPDIFPHIDTLTQTVAKFNLHKHPHFMDAGLEMEDLDDSIQALESLAGCYE